MRQVCQLAFFAMDEPTNEGNMVILGIAWFYEFLYVYRFFFSEEPFGECTQRLGRSSFCNPAKPLTVPGSCSIPFSEQSISKSRGRMKLSPPYCSNAIFSGLLRGWGLRLGTSPRRPGHPRRSRPRRF